MLGRRDVMDEPAVPVAPARARRLPMIALALASLAAVLLVVALVRRAGHGEPETGGSAGSNDGPGLDHLGKPSPDALVDPAVVAMFGAVCRYEVGCGVGSLPTCDKVERTMRQMPKKLSLRPCDHVNEDLAKQCVATLGSMPSCRDFAKSLAIYDLQQALDRVTPCRRACDP